jgi:hypothetical protein
MQQPLCILPNAFIPIIERHTKRKVSIEGIAIALMLSHVPIFLRPDGLLFVWMAECNDITFPFINTYICTQSS